MSLLSSIEARIGRLVEGTFGRMFRSHVQPVELARRLVKEMDDHRSGSLQRVFVPNVYEIFLGSEDYRNFGSISTELCAELSEYLYAHAQREGYALHSRPRVSMKEDADLALGSFGIATAIEQEDLPDVVAAARDADDNAGHTMVFTPEQAAQVRTALPLALQTPNGLVELGAEPLTLGRGSANDIVLSDSSVSREHARIVPSGTGHAIRDLGATNGVLVNGAQVTEHTIDMGDTLTLGNIELHVVRGTGDAR